VEISGEVSQPDVVQSGVVPSDVAPLNLASALLFLRANASAGALEAALKTGGSEFRARIGEWIVQLVPVESLVAEAHREWRPIVRDAMLFVIAKLSDSRLAAKIVEQLDLPSDAPPETRLLHLIARVPGLQKIGQVLARNRGLDPRLRHALAELENGISDAGIEEIREIIFRRLGKRVEKYSVRVEKDIFSEASVSAVVKFTWLNPATRRRERGVFKVLKPYVRSCYAEDMSILQKLAQHLARKHDDGSINLVGLSETLADVRLLLEREVNFRREQATLSELLAAYRAVPGVRVPRPIEPLCSSDITALTHENGVKVTEAFAHPSYLHARVAERLAEALIAVPVLSTERSAIFHADPHAGNILYDRRRGELVILDWALAEILTREQRRDVLMLTLSMALRDAASAARAIERLLPAGRAGSKQAAAILRRVKGALDAMPPFHVAGPSDAMRLLDGVALEGARFPAALLMFRKATFTLEGVLEDIAGRAVGLNSVVRKYAVLHWLDSATALWRLLTPFDWIFLEWSALTFCPRWAAQTALGLCTASTRSDGPALRPERQLQPVH
jgi:ubiquinone biosynthesis protein